MTRIFNIALTTTAAAALAACGSVPLTPANANFNELRERYPDLTAVEFAVLDTNNDGMVDATEEQAIGSDDIGGLDVSDDS